MADQVFVDDEGFLRVFGTNDNCDYGLRTPVWLSAYINGRVWIMGALA